MCASHDSTTYILYTLYLQSVYKVVTYACVFEVEINELNWIDQWRHEVN